MSTSWRRYSPCRRTRLARLALALLAALAAMCIAVPAAPAAVWSEVGDAGGTTATAQTAELTGPQDTIVGTISSTGSIVPLLRTGDADLYRFCVGTSAFTIWTETKFDPVTNLVPDPTLSLLAPDGTFVQNGIDGAPLSQNSFDAQVGGPNGQPGAWFIGIVSNPDLWDGAGFGLTGSEIFPYTIHVQGAVPCVGAGGGGAVPATPAIPDLDTGSDTGRSHVDDITRDDTPTFTGTADAGTTVKVLVDGVEKGSAPATGGSYSVTTTSIPEGSHTVTATATDTAGATSSASAPLTVLVDTTPPAAPTTPDLEAASDTGVSSSDDVTTDVTPTFTGSAEADAFVRLLVDNQIAGADTAAGPTGLWLITSTQLALGTHAVTASAEDIAGNVSPLSGTLAVTIVAPTACQSATNNITGTAGPDVLTGTAGGDRLLGLAGNDDLSGLGGNDCLDGSDGADRLRGDAGDDELRGGNGGDRITPGAGRDLVDAGAGDDNIDANDGARDSIDCGPGTKDQATIDSLDVTSGCERVDRR